MLINDVLNTSNYVNIDFIRSESALDVCLDTPSICSPYEEFKEYFKISAAYDSKRKTTKEKVFAVILKIQIPRMTSDTEVAEFTKRFMNTLKNNSGQHAYRDKLLPYAFWTSQEGLGDYVNILCSQREIYPTGLVVPDTFVKTTYVNKHTHCFTKKDDPDVIIFHKDDQKISKDGEPLFKTIYCSEKKDNTFNFLTSHDQNLKQNRFNGFIYSLKQVVKRTLYAMNNLNVEPFRGTIKTLKYFITDATDKKAKVLRFNIELGKIKEIESIIRFNLLERVKKTYKVEHVGELNKEFIKKYKRLKKMKKSIDVLMVKHSGFALDTDITYDEWDAWISEDMTAVKNRLKAFAKDCFDFAEEGWDRLLEMNLKRILMTRHTAVAS